MALYEEHISEFEARNAQVLGISVDSIDSVREWTKSLGGISFPHLSDFWPHGDLADRFGILRPNGTSERAVFAVDRDGIIRYITISRERGKIPPVDELLKILDKLS